MTQFSVVVPTLNEAENIHLLLTRIFALDLEPSSFEVIFVDDGSSDGTADQIRSWKEYSNVRLIERQDKPDLTASILAGAAIANSDIIVVMDADLSHPTERLSAVVKPVLDGDYDVAVGSRYVPGGSVENWPFYRRLLSRVVKTVDDYKVKHLQLAAISKGRSAKRSGVHTVTDEIYLPGRVNPLKIEKHSAAMHIMQMMRDEAHRFALSSHRKRRSKDDLLSRLDGIQGVGATRRRALLTHFRSIEEIRIAPEEEIASLKGFNRSVARRIKESLQ